MVTEHAFQSGLLGAEAFGRGSVTKPHRFRKKPVEVTAIQWTGDNVNAIWEAFGVSGIYGPTELNPGCLILTTVHGDPATCRVGDWVIPDGAPDTFYPCANDIFTKTYEPVKDEN